MIYRSGRFPPTIFPPSAWRAPGSVLIRGSTLSVRVRLDDNERSMVDLIASARNDPKERAGVRSRRLVSNLSNLDIHILGVGAEAAVGKHFGVLPSFASSLFGDSGLDLTINGLTCEVKCRTNPKYDFLLPNPNRDSFRSDIGILVYSVGPYVYDIHGYIERAKLLEVAVIRNFGYGDCLAVAREHFIDIRSFTSSRVPPKGRQLVFW